jgi:hypothetical protein
MEKSPSEELEKYKELYILSLEVLKEEQTRFNRIDDKASKYFSVLTILLGILGFFGKWVINNFIPPKSTLEYLLIILAILLSLSVLFSWFLTFKVFKIHYLKTIPLDSNMFDYFKDNKLIDIYYGLAKGNKNAFEDNCKITDYKSLMLTYSYKIIIVSVFLVCLFTFFYGFHIWK